MAHLGPGPVKRLQAFRHASADTSDGFRLEGLTLTDGAELPFSFLFADGLLETSVPGVYAAGDVRAGSIKRCATAVGEGATVVRFVHERMAAVPPNSAN